ncbi:MAG: 50S ribosomal protein L14 [Candidatus Magasanikbacteria bacterium]
MIQEGTVLKIADNSGAKTAKCFKVLGGSKKRYAKLGDIIKASVQKADPGKEVKKNDVVDVLVVRQKKAYRRSDGSYVRFDDNAGVVMDGKLPVATRIFGPIAREVKAEGFQDVVSLAEDVV